jgi:hypothetical protein
MTTSRYQHSSSFVFFMKCKKKERGIESTQLQ